MSSHEFGAPKESPQFWERLRVDHSVDLRRTLFVDDSHAVLHAALAAGVAWAYQVLQPDSTQPPHAPLADVPGILRLADLAESLRAQLSDALSVPDGGVVRSGP